MLAADSRSCSLSRTLFCRVPAWCTAVVCVVCLAGGACESSKERMTRAACDRNYIALNELTYRELTAAVIGVKGECGARTSGEVCECIVRQHQHLRNPVDESSAAYTLETPSYCQVQLSSAGDRSILVGQWMQHSISPERFLRTFRIDAGAG